MQPPPLHPPTTTPHDSSPPPPSQSDGGPPPVQSTSSSVSVSLYSPPSVVSRPHGASDSAVSLPVARSVSATAESLSFSSLSSPAYSPLSAGASSMVGASHTPSASFSAASVSSSSSASALYQSDRSWQSSYHPPPINQPTAHLPPAVRRPASTSAVPSSTATLSRPGTGSISTAATAAAAAVAAGAATASQPLQPNLHISGLQVLDVVVCRPRGFIIKRGLLQTYIPSALSSDASASPTRGGTPLSGTADDVSSPASGQLSANSARSPGSPALPSPPATFTTPASLSASSLPSSTAASTASSTASSTATFSSAASSTTHFAVRPVLVKTFSTKNPTDEAITRLRFEYLAFQKLSTDVNRPLALVSHEEEGLCILYDDCGGLTIDRLQYDSGVRAGVENAVAIVEAQQAVGGVAATAAVASGSENSESAELQLKSSPMLSPTGSPKPAIPQSLSPAGSSSASSTVLLSPSQSQPSNPSTRLLRPLTAILRLARALSCYLLRLHDQGVIYKAVRPSTILYNSDTDRCILLEYHASSLLSRERAVIDDLTEHSADTSVLLYISPEQSGRMNRALDSRTDIYSLGVVMYQLLVGQPPFVSSDPMEVIHFHLAKACPDPLAVLQQRGGAINELEVREKEALGWLSAIILKCVSKQAEDRYQSAAGLLSDLDYCYRLMLNQNEPTPILSPLSVTRSLPSSPTNSADKQVQQPPQNDDTLSVTSVTASSSSSSSYSSSSSSSSAASAQPSSTLSLSPSTSSLSTQPFAVGRMDVLSQFRISQKLYGREDQVRVLLDAFARISGDDVESVYGEWNNSHDSTDENGSSRAHTPPGDRSHTTAIINSLHIPRQPPSSHSSTPSPRPPPRPELVLIAGYSGIG